jgi:hypothetical protein
MFYSSTKLWSLTAAAVICLSASAAYGQATRTWVSGVGDDVNPCSRTAPCKTFAGAISKTAAGGEINVLDPGGFGAVTITKSITIDGSPMLAGVLVSGTAGIIVNASASDVVTLRGIDINGIGGSGTKGIQIIQAGRVVIEDCEIYGFSPRGISVEPSANPVQVFISRTRLKGSASNGIVVQPANASIKAQVTLNNVEIAESTNFGLSVTAGGVVTVRDSALSDNGSLSAAGIRVDGTGGAASVDLDNVLINGSSTGILSLTNSTVRINNSSILNNGTGLSLSGGSILSFGNNRLVGNIVNGSFSGSVALQ